ncbi:MAG: T9SS type A sorting domain-containing protein, partial [Bacteroidota bacterium]
TIVSYQSNNIDLWRTGAIYNRPKWGMYRAKTDGLKDEMFRFADFCISESEEALCPADSTETISSLENQEAHDIQIYPNPTKKHLFVQSSAGNIQSIQLVDASGKTVLLANKQEKYMLDISTLPKGVYLLLVEQKDKKIVREKVFVME